MLGSYVGIIVVITFIAVCMLFFKPLADNVTSTDPSYSSGYEKYLWYILPVVFIGGGIVLFFAPNGGGGR